MQPLQIPPVDNGTSELRSPVDRVSPPVVEQTLVSAPGWWPEIAAGFIGLGVFLSKGGGRILDPRSVEWLFVTGDPASHFLGWHFFRQDPWGWPLGSFHSFVYPLGGTIGYTDSIPWLAVFFKLLSPGLPAIFQYQGLWLGACFVLQAVIGARLTSLCSPLPAHRLLGGALFALSPILARRYMHEALCGQWLLLLAMLLVLTPRLTASRALWGSVALVGFAAGVHPYLAAMVWVLSLSGVFHRVRQRTLRPLAGVVWGLGLFAMASTLFFVLGYFQRGYDTSASGFGFFSADLLSLVNPVGHSRFLPSASASDGHRFEGFGYLGLGVLLLSLLALGIRFGYVRRSVLPSSFWPYAAGALFLALFSLSNMVTLHDMLVLDLTRLYAPLKTITGPFRSSGRFIWPLHYTITFAALAGVLAARRQIPNLTSLILAGAVAVQAMDYRDEPHFLPAPPSSLSVSPAWDLLKGDYRHVALYPPQILYSTECNQPNLLLPSYYRRFALAAAKYGLTLNSGHLARVRPAETARMCTEFMRHFENGDVEPDTLYVVRWSHRDRIPNASLVCREANEGLLCVARDRPTLFSHWVNDSPVQALVLWRPK